MRRMLSVVTFLGVLFLLLFLVYQRSLTTNYKLDTLTTNRNIDETSDESEESKKTSDDSEESKKPSDDSEESKKPPDDSEVSKKPPDDSEESKKQLKRQDKRKQNVKVVCKNLTGKTLIDNGKIVKSRFSTLFVDDINKFLYCRVPKVATTSWKRILLILTGKMNTTNPSELNAYAVHRQLHKRYLRTLNQYTKNEIRYRLKNYYKFMFVREPFERLLSAYRDRVVSNRYYDYIFHHVHVKRYRKLPRQRDLKTGDGVRFEKFVKYLLETNTTFNRHWQLYHKMCHPCFVQYDFIGKYETLKEDVDLVMFQLGIQDLIKFPDSPNKGEKTSEIVAREFENISESSVRRLWEIYSTDFSLFGYKYPSFKTDD